MKSWLSGRFNVGPGGCPHPEKRVLDAVAVVDQTRNEVGALVVRQNYVAVQIDVLTPKLT